jgi:hypothetical protein
MEVLDAQSLATSFNADGVNNNLKSFMQVVIPVSSQALHGRYNKSEPTLDALSLNEPPRIAVRLTSKEDQCDRQRSCSIEAVWTCPSSTVPPLAGQCSHPV